MRYFKRGDDYDFLAERVRSGVTQTLLPSATLSWQFVDASNVQVNASGGSPAGNGNCTLTDANTATYSGSIPKEVTANTNLNDVYVLQITILNSGKRTTLGVVMKAVDIMPVTSL